jgi:hypothetical protein
VEGTTATAGEKRQQKFGQVWLFKNERKDPACVYVTNKIAPSPPLCRFVNMSPAASNSAETKGSLEYAKNMKKITNTVTKSIDNNEVSELKQEIKALKARLG